MQRSDAAEAVRLLRILATGDYRHTFERLRAGGDENYYAQRYSMECDADLTQQVEQMGILCCRGGEADDCVLDNGVRAMNAGLNQRSSPRELLPWIERFAPTHLVVHPAEPVWIGWAIRHEVRVLPILASSFSPSYSGHFAPRRWIKRIRSAHRRRRLVSELQHPSVVCVASHNVGSCEGLTRIGVSAEKLVPWDWPAMVRPEDHAVKQPRDPHDAFTLVFVGLLVESKGVGDCIDAVGLLRRSGVAARLRVIGSGDAAPFRSRAAECGVEDHVVFEGVRAHHAVLDAMREADIVIVPSRHDYDEGLPMTIYEALAVRTPLVCSDHPMFVSRLRDGEATLVFRERSADSLAACVRRLTIEPDLYRQLSMGTASAWARIQIPTRQIDLVRAFLAGDDAIRRILERHSLAKGRYHGITNHSGTG